VKLESDPSTAGGVNRAENGAGAVAVTLLRQVRACRGAYRTPRFSVWIRRPIVQLSCRNVAKVYGKTRHGGSVSDSLFGRPDLVLERDAVPEDQLIVAGLPHDSDIAPGSASGATE